MLRRIKKLEDRHIVYKPTISFYTKINDNTYSKSNEGKLYTKEELESDTSGLVMISVYE